MRIINLVEDTPGVSGCRYEHGLSFYVETKRHRLLVDSGATDMFRYNAEAMGIDLKQVDTLILSHGHYDHGGGIPAFVNLNPKAAVYIKAEAGGEYYHLKDSGEKYIGIDRNIMELKQCVIVEGDLRIDEELFLFSDLAGTKYPAKGNQELKQREGNDFIQDNFRHEQCVVITQDNRQILMSGCAHNGILNILDRYEQLFRSMPDVVVSGFHMMQKDPYSEEDVRSIEETARALLETGAVFYTGHCTGQTAYDIMERIMGNRLKAIHSGVRIV